MDIEHLIFQSYFQKEFITEQTRYEIGDSTLSEEKNYPNGYFYYHLMVQTQVLDWMFFITQFNDYIYLESNGTQQLVL